MGQDSSCCVSGSRLFLLLKPGQRPPPPFSPDDVSWEENNLIRDVSSDKFHAYVSTT